MPLDIYSSHALDFISQKSMKNVVGTLIQDISLFFFSIHGKCESFEFSSDGVPEAQEYE